MLDRLRAGALARPGADERTLPQWMSDTAVATLLTGVGDLALLEGITPRVSITMPATLLTGATGTGLDGSAVGGPPGADGGVAEAAAPAIRDGDGEGQQAEPPQAAGDPAGSLVTVLTGSPHAELADGQLIDTATALRLAGQATSWTRVFTDPVTAVTVAADQYRPGQGLRRLIRTRDQTCRFPGCNAPAENTDLDHTHPHNRGGRTDPHNLACLCRRHHRLKHVLGPDHGWTVRQPTPGVLEWTSPTGRKHLIEPEPQPTALTIDPGPPLF